MPVYFMDGESATVYYNSETAESMEIEIPEDILTKGTDLSQK